MLIAQLSDIHLDDENSFERLERVLHWVTGLKPDAVAVSGDPRAGNRADERARRLLVHHVKGTNLVTHVISVGG